MSTKELFTKPFKGRASRKTYFRGCGMYIASLPLQILGFLMIGAGSHGAEVFSDTQLIIFLVCALTYLALWLWFLLLFTGLCVRRLHDAGHSGWPAVIVFIPTPFLVGQMALMYYAHDLPADPAENSYGLPEPNSGFRQIVGL